MGSKFGKILTLASEEMNVPSMKECWLRLIFIFLSIKILCPNLLLHYPIPNSNFVYICLHFVTKFFTVGILSIFKYFTLESYGEFTSFFLVQQLVRAERIEHLISWLRAYVLCQLSYDEVNGVY